MELYDKSTPMYNSIYKESLEKRPYEIVRLLSETKDQDTIIPTTLDGLMQILFREQDLFDLKDLKQNKVDLSTLEKTAQVKKYLEDIDRVRKYKQPLQEYYQTEPEMLKQRLVEILRTTTLIDPTYNLTRVLVTILQKLGVDCVYADNTYKYPNKAAWEAYLLVITNKKGVIIYSVFYFQSKALKITGIGIFEINLQMEKWNTHQYKQEILESMDKTTTEQLKEVCKFINQKIKNIA